MHVIYITCMHVIYIYNMHARMCHVLIFLLFVYIYMIERHKCVKSGSIPNKCGWPDSPQPSSNLIYANTPL